MRQLKQLSIKKVTSSGQGQLEVMDSSNVATVYLVVDTLSDQEGRDGLPPLGTWSVPTTSEFIRSGMAKLNKEIYKNFSKSLARSVS